MSAKNLNFPLFSTNPRPNVETGKLLLPFLETEKGKRFSTFRLTHLDSGGNSRRPLGSTRIYTENLPFPPNLRGLGKGTERTLVRSAEPTLPGPHIQAIQIIRCSYPTVLALTVEQSGKKVTLYANNYYKVVFTTTYDSNDEIKPCTAIEDMKASVKYAEVSDQKVAGQILSIELSK